MIDALWDWLVEGDDQLVWDHEWRDTGGTGAIPAAIYGYFQPNEPLLGFYRVSINMEEDAWFFATPQGFIVVYDDGRVIAVNNVDMRHASIPSGFFSFSALKTMIVSPWDGELLTCNISPKDADELDEMRTVCRVMVESGHEGRPNRMRDLNQLPRLIVADNEEPGKLSARKRQVFCSRRTASGRNPFEADIPSSSAGLRNPFEDSWGSRPGGDDNPFA
ncbi:hypothetical protein ACWJIK_06720 [Corynebacterium minutissimum]